MEVRKFNALFLTLVLQILVGSAQDFTCSRNRTEVESGRTCKPACENYNECVGSVCICDGACGKSCVNRNSRCSRPGQIKNGNVVVPSLSYGSVAKFSCSDNFILYGSQERVCRSDRKWSGSKTYCRQYKCPAPEAIINADFQPKLEEHYAGTKVTFQCADGYFLGKSDNSGRPIVAVDKWCESRGLWFGDDVKCIPITTCDPRTPPENGQLLSYLSSSVVTYSKVKYSCNKGFYLRGSEFAECDMTTGEWSNPEPTCEGILCPERSTPTNGQMMLSNGRLEGSMVLFNCDTGFKLTGAQTAICLSSGEWSQPAPTCESIHCPATSYIPGTYAITATDTRVGSEMSFQCADGLRQAIEPNLYCSETGEWTPKVKCEEITCPERYPPSNGKIEYYPADSRQYTTRLTYSCNDSYRLVGFSVMFCEKNGEWSEDIPYCTEISKYSDYGGYYENGWAMASSGSVESGKLIVLITTVMSMFLTFN